METTEEENIRNACEKITSEFIEWLEWLDAGEGYTAKYYQNNIQRKLTELKSRYNKK